MNRTLFLFLALAATCLCTPPLPAWAQGSSVKPSGPVGHVETDLLSVDISSQSSGVRAARLKGERFSVEGKPANLVTTEKPEYLPFAFRLDGVKDDGSPFAVQQLGPRAVRLVRETDGVRITRKVEAGGPYQLWLTTRFDNTGVAPKKIKLTTTTHHYVTRESEGSHVPILPVQSHSVSSGLCRHGGELEREHRDKLTEAAASFAGDIQFTGIASVYFLNALSPEHAGDVEGCTIYASDRGKDSSGNALGTLFTSELAHKPIELQPGASRTYKTLAYIGPKVPDELTIAGHGLKQAIEGGWFSSIAEGLTWLLRNIHERVGNWGIAIILLTVLVKTLLFPLTAKQMQSMGRMKELKPEMDRINELYADDREKKGAAIMELYRKRGVNPMAGCFPVLLQMPIWFSLYASLSTNVQLLNAPFAVWHDLSSPDPFFILPVALGVLMFVQQKMAPATSADPMQAKMMLYMMPTMMTGMMLFLPAGLCLYTLTNSALSIGQQRFIEARLKSAPSSDKKDDDDEPPSSSSSAAPADPSNDSQRLRLNRPSKAERRSIRGKR